LLARKDRFAVFKLLAKLSSALAPIWAGKPARYNSLNPPNPPASLGGAEEEEDLRLNRI